MGLRFVVPVTFLLYCASIHAQSYAGDARKIGLGGIGHSENLATKMIEQERPYGSTVLPLGFIQLSTYRKHFDPNDDEFDPVLVLESVANPLHYVIGRNPAGTRGKFVKDAVNGELARDLNQYRGFRPTNHLLAEGLASPNWGKTVKVWKRDDGSFQGFYIGAGPYLSAKTELNIDAALTEILGSSAPVPLASLANKTFAIHDTSVGQAALAVTGGYRGRIALPGRQRREGVYVGMNYHYLRGFRYEDAKVTVRFDTDSNGQLAVLPATAPAVVDRLTAKSGSGYAVDVGVAAVVDRMEVGFGVNGIGNRIQWNKLTGHRYQMASLVQGGSFVKSSIAPPSTLEVRLPVDYTGSAAYQGGRWSVVGEGSRGFQGSRFHGGMEYRFSWVEFRGGGGYFLEKWHPTGGISLRLSERAFLDVAAFGSTTNIERELRPAIAVSIRVNRGS